MNFEPSDEQKLIKHTAREFARKEIAPRAAACDREARFPMEVQQQAREIGLTNMTAPREYGGSGWGVLEQALVTEELAWGCTGITGALGLNAIFAMCSTWPWRGKKSVRLPACSRASSAPTQ
jgi:acyl-CoA dehydrogenase